MKAGYSISPGRCIGSELRDGNLHLEMERCEDSEAAFWAIYEHDKDGLSEWICECRNKKTAEVILRALIESRQEDT